MTQLIRGVCAVLCAVAAVAMLRAQTTYSETVLHSFAVDQEPKGAYPAALFRDSAGNLYAPASGGAWGKGVVFEVNAAGQSTVLHEFRGGAKGNGPVYGVIRDDAGNLYGTTLQGGNLSGRICGGDPAYGCGVIYRLDPSGHETVLYSFTGSLDGAYPSGALIRDAAGNLYGTASDGGASSSGTVFKLDPSGQFSVLYAFTGGADGSGPAGGLILDDAGNLYGTTQRGGTFTSCHVGGCGVVYKLDAAGNETVLYAFTGGADGRGPSTGVIRDSDGNLYGTTPDGGLGKGVVFKLDSSGHETVLYAFTGRADGGNSYAGLVRDQAGNLYGTTSQGGYFGGTGECTTGCGVVFKVDPSGNETVLHRFKGSDGASPEDVILDASGNLYGTTGKGGVSDTGLVYKLDTSGQEAILDNFPLGPDGENPEAGVVRDAAGNLYGTTVAGGYSGRRACTSDTSIVGCGVVYKIDAAGHETKLHSFTSGDDGQAPVAGVTLDAAGNLYGTTPEAGANNGGVVYKVDTAGNETVLHTFAAPGSNGDDGATPVAGVTLDSAGNLYGTSENGGGPGGTGIVYKLDASGTETILYSFADGQSGRPTTGVILDPAGNLYGTTSAPASAYKLDSAGTYTVLHDFPDGSVPSGLTRDSAGNLYGTTEFGGACNQPQGCGVIFKLDTEGHYQVLYAFPGGPNGRNPLGGVTLDPTGNLYGTAQSGGAMNFGVVFKLDTSGNYTVLYTFEGAPDGISPWAGVTLDPAGNIYGTTYAGGKQKSGVVFKLTPQ